MNYKKNVVKEYAEQRIKALERENQYLQQALDAKDKSLAELIQGHAGIIKHVTDSLKNAINQDPKLKRDIEDTLGSPAAKDELKRNIPNLPGFNDIDDILGALEKGNVRSTDFLNLTTQRLNTNTANKLDIEQIVKDSKEQVEKATVNEPEAVRTLDLKGMIDELKTAEASNEKAVVKKIEEPKERKEIWRPF